MRPPVFFELRTPKAMAGKMIEKYKNKVVANDLFKVLEPRNPSK